MGECHVQLNSVVFHTTKLSELRAFYEGKLGLPTGTYLKEGTMVPDLSETYVNYHIGGAMLCFEYSAERTDAGTVILHVPSFRTFRTQLEAQGIRIVGGNDHWFKIKDPDGRSLIIEPGNEGAGE
jgi:catechol 2,3-dioxygenase-like lactoylglutathione lyase family enzyme